MGFFRMRREAKHNIERNAKIAALFEAGATYDQIASQLGITRNVVAGCLYRTARRRGEGRRLKYPEHIRQVILKSAEARGVASAVREWGVSAPSIYNWRKAVGA